MEINKKYRDAMKLILDYMKEIAQNNNIKIEDIAQKTAFSENNVKRMLSGRYAPRLDHFIMLCEACNANIFITNKNKKK